MYMYNQFTLQQKLHKHCKATLLQQTFFKKECVILTGEVSNKQTERLGRQSPKRKVKKATSIKNDRCSTLETAVRQAGLSEDMTFEQSLMEVKRMNRVIICRKRCKG